MWADVNDGVGEKMRRWCQKVMVGRWVVLVCGWPAILHHSASRYSLCLASLSAAPCKVI